MIKSALGLCAAILMAAAPAAAANPVDLSFGGQAQTAPQFSYTAGGIDFTAQAYSWFFNPNPLTSVSQLSAGTLQVQRSAPGIGVAGGMNGDQIDSAMPWGREGILITGSEDFAIHGLVLSLLGGPDSLALYGVDGGNLVLLGYPGLAADGVSANVHALPGQASWGALDPANGGTQTLSFITPTDAYSAFFFTTRDPGSSSYLNSFGFGYRLDAIRVTAAGGGLGGEGGGVIGGGVPEPASWAMLIMGFGLVGAISRRRRITVAA